MDKATKNRKNLFLVLKLTFLLFLGYVVFVQLQKFDWDASIQWKNIAFLPLFIMVLLLPLNYFLEWKKWKVIVNEVSTIVTFKTQLYSFFAGIITGMLTPNMQGNFIGRIYYFPRNERVKIIVLTLWSNFIQFIIALFFGMVSIWVIGSDSYFTISFELKVALSLIVILSLFIVFFAGKFLLLFKRLKNAKRLHHLLHSNATFSFEILFWGTLRYLVFAIQFLLVLHAFGGPFSIAILVLIWQVYLWTTIAPSLFLGKLVIRETIAIWVLSSIGIGDLTLVLCSLIVWFVNLVLPTVIGLIICKRKEL